MNPYKPRVNSDFEANTQLPEWAQIGEGTETPNISPFVDALKKRMMKPPDAGGLGASMGSMAGGSSSGGMKSL